MSPSLVCEVSSTGIVPPKEIVQVSAGTILPIVLIDGILAGSTTVGDTIQARLSTDIHLKSGQIIRVGTLILGHVDAVAATSAPFNGASTVQVTFDQLRMSDATIVPFAANIVAGVQAEQELAMRCSMHSERSIMIDGEIAVGSAPPASTANGAQARPRPRKGLILPPNTALYFPAGQILILELSAPAQVVVQGSYL